MDFNEFYLNGCRRVSVQGKFGKPDIILQLLSPWQINEFRTLIYSGFD